MSVDAYNFVKWAKNNTSADTVNRTKQTLGATASTLKRESSGNWYSGSQPTLGEIYAQIQRIGETDPESGKKAVKYLTQLQSDKSSQFYRPYSQPTSYAAKNLAALGFDTSILDDNFFNSQEYQTFMAENLERSTTTGNKKSPGKKSTVQNQWAYYLDDYYDDYQRTKAVKDEYNAAMNKARYLAGDTDHNYSDQEILDLVNQDFEKNYPTLSKMKSSGTDPIKLTEAIDFSDDALLGAIWEGRNPEYNGGIEGAMAFNYLGKGNTYKENPEITARLTEGSPEYAPYYVGATMGEDLSYFGLYSANQKWVDDNFSRIMAGNDEEAKEHARNIADGVQYTAKLNSERDEMQKQIDNYIEKGYTNPDFIINKIKENTDAYGDLFALDETMEVGKQYGKLKSTTDKVPYRWQDVENEIRTRCEEENNKRDAMSLAENRGYPHSTIPTAQQTIKNKNDDDVDAVSGADNVVPGAYTSSVAKDIAEKPVFSETEKANEEAFKKDILAVSPTISAVGTDAEKTAMMTGKTSYYDLCVKRMRDRVDNIADSFVSKSSQDIETKYFGDAKTVFNYEKRQNNFLENQSRLNEIMPEWEKLSSKIAENEAVSSMSSDEYANLIEFVNANPAEHPGWDIIKRELDLGPGEPDPYDDSNERTLGYTYALNALYDIVAGTSDQNIPEEEKLAKAKNWYGYMTEASPVQKIVKDANKTGDEVDELEIERNGMLIRLEKNDSGRFEFSSAVDTRTGDAYGADRMDEVNEKLGSDRLSSEEGARFTELNRIKDSLEGAIMEDKDYLGAYQEEYENANRESNFIKLSFVEAVRSAKEQGIDVDPLLINKIDKFTIASGTPVDVQQYAYNYYDESVEQGLYTSEQVTKAAIENAAAYEKEAQDLKDVLVSFDRMGITVSEEDRANIQAHIAQLNSLAKEAGYVALDGNEDFEEVAESTHQKVMKHELDVDVSDMVETAMTGKSSTQIGLENVLGRNNIVSRFISGKDTLDTIFSSQEITRKEWNRFYYILGEDGKEEAQKYLDYLLNPENGMVTMRSSIDKANWWQEYAKNNPVSGFIAGRVAGVLSAPSSLGYRLGQKVRGENVNGYDRAYDFMNAKAAADAGAASAITDLFGGAKIAGDIYNITAGITDMAISRRIIGTAVEDMAAIIQDSSLGVAIAGMKESANATANATASKVFETAESLGADFEEAFKLSYDAGVKAAASSAAGKGLKIVNMLEKGMIDVTSILPMAMNSAEQTYHNVLMTNGEEAAEKMSAVEFFTSLVSHAVVFRGIHKAFAANPDSVTSGISGFMEHLLTNEAAVGASGLATNTIKAYAEKAILEADSQYGKDVDRYLEEGYSKSVAERLADQDMQDNIFRNTFEEMANAALRTGITYAAGVGINALKNYRASRKENDVKDLSIINDTYGSSPTATAVGLSAVLDDPDMNVSKAAGQSFVALCGDADVAASAMQMMIANTPNPAETKSDIVVAALVDGAGKYALTSIIAKVQTGQQITAGDINALHNGVEEDRSASPERLGNAIADAVKENRIANLTNRILTLPANKNRIETAETNAADKKRDADAANDYMIQKQNEAQAAADNLMSAEANYNPEEDTQTGGPLQQQTEKLLGADTAATQAEDSYKQQQQIADEAQKKLDDIRNEVTTSARQEATVQVEQEMANEQAVRDQQAQAAAEAEQQYQTLMVQEAEADAAEHSANLADARRILAEKGQTGEYLERNAQRMAELMEQQKRGQIDTTKELATQEDADALLRRLSRGTGVTIEMQDLGDPFVVRERIDDKNRLILNSRLPTAQALIGAAAHGFTHALEDTGAYQKYAALAMQVQYGGRGSAEYNKEIINKINDYNRFGQSLDVSGAEKELVSEFTRLKLANKKFVRKAVAQGIGSDIHKQLSTSLDLLKGYKFKGAAKREVNQMQKAERLFWEAVDERARMVKEGYNGHTGISQFSIGGVSQAAGLTVEVTDDDNYRYKLYDAEGNELAPGNYTPEMVNGTPVGKLIDLPAVVLRDELDQKVKDGIITKEEADAEYNSKLPDLQKAASDQRKFISDIVNMIGQYQDAAMVWELAGSLAFSCIKANGDHQYSDSFDMGTVCTKVQAILNVISESQVRLGRALTKDEIDNIVYTEVGKGVQDENGNWKHGATPCPPCYVYATWVNKPARLEKVRQYQNECKDWTDEQITEFMNAPALEGKTKTETTALRTEQNAKKLWISLCLADEHKNPDTKVSTWTRKDDPQICPNEILLDLRRSGDMATQYPGVWTFMQKGGNSQGKAIAPYSDSRLGESIIGKAIGADELNKRLLADAQNAGNPDYVPQFLNPFLITGDEKADAMAKDYFKRAVAKAKAQNLKGGQRWQSWSDFRAEWGSDYLMEMLTMQALGATVQTYTKVPEALDLFASAGFEVNMSLMPHGDGFEHNEDGSIKTGEDGKPILKFSKVTGIDPESAKFYAKKYGNNVQPMVVGISDQHILAAMDGDQVMFIIPFHGSGGSVARLQNLMSQLGEQMKTGYDYTNAQTDSFENYKEVGEGKNKKLINTNSNWRLREAIITGEYESLTDKDKDDIDMNPYLSKLYEDRYINEKSDAYGVFFSREDAQQIYPYEYWDTTTTLANADRNSQRFIEYCQMLGVVPRFSGLTRKAAKGKFFTPEQYGIAEELNPDSFVYDDKGRVIQFEYANFSGAKRDADGNIIGYDPKPGYWKLLIDRNMYKRVYDENGKLIKDQCTYHKPEAVNVSKIEVGSMPMAANNTVGHNNDETGQIADRVNNMILATNAAQNMTLGNTPSEQEEIRTVTKKAMYADSDVQLSAGGLYSDDELLEMMDADQLEKEQAGYPSSAVKLQTYQSPEQRNAIKDYLGSTDQRLIDAANALIENNKQWIDPIELQSVSDREANDIMSITGADVSGYSHVVDKNFFNHIQRRHGPNGNEDHSMADVNDISRVGWIINNYDEVILDDNTVHSFFSRGYKDKNNEVMPKIKYIKHVDGNIYVVEAVGENKAKQLHLLSAYMENTNPVDNNPQGNAASRVPDAFASGDTSETPHGSPADEIITQPENGVNNQNSLGGELSDAELLSLMADNGIISPEMIPYSYVPSTNVNYGSNQRQFGYKTAQESNALHEQVREYLYNNSSYIPDTNAEQIDRALGWVKSNATESDPDGYYASLKEVMDPDFNYRTADGQAQMLTVMGMAALKADQGDERALQDEIDLADAYNKQGTDLGQALQARKLFRMMTPVGRKALLQREADRMNQNLADLGKKYRVAIPDELLEEAAKAKTEDEFEKAKKKIRKSLNEQLPVTWGERIIGWRMLSMLSAPKTHIRNVVGNALFVPVVGTKNKVAAVMEAGAQAFGKLDKSERTKTIGFSNPAARKFASSRAKDVKDILRGNAKYGEGDKRQQDRKIFGTKDNPISQTFGKALQWWYDVNGKALEYEDWVFLKYHYTRALGGYMTARGLKPEDMKGTVLEDADLYAIQEAHKATYRDDSPVANWMNRIGSKKANAENNKALSVIQWIVNTRFPFKRTPINIAKRGIEYSAVGLGKSLTYDARRLKQYLDAKNGKLEKMPKSAISPTEWIDRFASGLTGTGIMIAGAVAAALGLARAGFDKDDPEDQIAKMAGEQEYSIRPGQLTDLELIDEDVSMTLDWAAPVVLPFFTGVGLQEYLEKEGFSVGGTLDLLMEVTEPMMNMSFMSGVSDIFKNNNYSTKDGFWQFIEKTGINFVTSLIPTWSGQIASTVNGRKTTYSGGESLTGDPDIDKMIQQIGNKIPWLNLGGVPYTNDLGEEQEPVVASWAENLLSPAYFSKVDDSPEMKELARLYLADPQDNKVIVPAQPKKTIRVDGEDISLNGEQYLKLKADHGAVWRDTVQSLLDNPLYENASDDSKAAMFDLADQYATQVAKHMTNSRYQMDSWAESAYKNGNAGDVIINKIAAKNKQYYVEGQAKSFAEALMTNNGQDIKKYADELNESKASASDVRKQLTAYFKPLYKQAYQQGDETTMMDIEYILSSVNDYLDLDKPITKYTTKKDFDKWITSTDTVSDYEDEDENDWLNPGDTGSSRQPDRYIASNGMSDVSYNSKPSRPASDDDWGQYMDELDEYWQNYDFSRNDPVGQYGKGNIDMNSRKVVQNDDGSISTERSFSFWDDNEQKEILIPLIVNGEVLTEEQAIQHYYDTGEYLGKFDDWKDADEYAMMLHNRGDWYYHQ